MKIISISIMLMFVLGCASTPLPQQERELAFVDNYAGSKEEGYQKMMAHVSKMLVGPNHAISVRDEKAGKIIYRVELECKELSSALDITGNQYVTVNAEVDFKDGKIRQNFEILYTQRRDFSGNIATREISSISQLKDVKPCVERHRAEALAALNKKNNW